MAFDADAAWPLKCEVSFLLIQAEPASWLQRSIRLHERVGLIQVLDRFNRTQLKSYGLALRTTRMHRHFALSLRPPPVGQPAFWLQQAGAGTPITRKRHGGMAARL